MKLFKKLGAALTRLRERSDAEMVLKKLQQEHLYGVLLTASSDEQGELLLMYHRRREERRRSAVRIPYLQEALLQGK